MSETSVQGKLAEMDHHAVTTAEIILFFPERTNKCCDEMLSIVTMGQRTSIHHVFAFISDRQLPLPAAATTAAATPPAAAIHRVDLPAAAVSPLFQKHVFQQEQQRQQRQRHGRVQHPPTQSREQAAAAARGKHATDDGRGRSGACRVCDD